MGSPVAGVRDFFRRLVHVDSSLVDLSERYEEFCVVFNANNPYVFPNLQPAPQASRCANRRNGRSGNDGDEGSSSTEKHGEEELVSSSKIRK